MAAESASELSKIVVLLAAGVVAVPLFRRLGLGSVVGYLVAGLSIGPFGLGVFSEPQQILHVAELGVVMFLFIIGLEMQPSRLWALRRAIFGLGLAQVVCCGALLTGLGLLTGLAAPVAFIAAMGFVLPSTATVMAVLEERGTTSAPSGQLVVSILLLEDLMIVPLLAIVALLAEQTEASVSVSRWVTVGVAVAAITSLMVVGRYFLNPFFRVLADSKAREVMTAAALLVVLGAAYCMDMGGLSMALGAFGAGVMLSESTFRHQIEADIEPFRGILLGLFFMSVGMSLSVPMVLAEWPVLLSGVLAFVLCKSTGIYVVARLTRADHASALERAVLMGHGGEFAFVLFAAAASGGIIAAGTHAMLTAGVILSMALTPVAVMLLNRLRPRTRPQDMTGVDLAKGLAGSVLVIGFGRFGQIASSTLLARGIDVVIIENSTDMIRSAANFGFKVYYGDGTRLDVLHASGAASAKQILVCVDGKESINRIVDLVRHEFPLTPVLARAYDRQHATELIKRNVAFQVRETFESAMTFGAAALRELGIPEDEIVEVTRDVRRRDTERLQLQLTGGITAGRSLMHSNLWAPVPLTQPRQAGQALNEEAAQVIEPDAK